MHTQSYNAAIVLCDRSWIDNDNDDRNGIGGGLESDALRQDSCIMTVQLHLRRMLEARPVQTPLNDITDAHSIAYDGTTSCIDRDHCG